MLIDCTNIENPEDSFVINPPLVLPTGSHIVFHGNNYKITDILYEDGSGIINYFVTPVYDDDCEKTLISRELEDKVLTYCRQGQKLWAVKYVKEELGTGLKEAKDIVNKLCKIHGI